MSGSLEINIISKKSNPERKCEGVERKRGVGKHV